MLFLHNCFKEWCKAKAQSSLFHGPVRRWKCLSSPWHLANRRSTASQNGLPHPQNNLKKRPKPNLWTWFWGCPCNLVSQAYIGCGRSTGAMAGATASCPAQGQESPGTWEPARSWEGAALRHQGQHQGPFFNSSPTPLSSPLPPAVQLLQGIFS